MSIRSTPPTPEQAERIENAKKLYCDLEAHVAALPESRERALALTNLEQSSMWVTKAILAKPKGA